MHLPPSFLPSYARSHLVAAISYACSSPSFPSYAPFVRSTMLPLSLDPVLSLS